MLTKNLAVGLLALTMVTACAGQDPKYYLSIAPGEPPTSGISCLINLNELVEQTLNPQYFPAEDLQPQPADWVKDLTFDISSPPSETNAWTLRKFQTKFEHLIDSRIIKLDRDRCPRSKKSIYSKWSVRYSLNGADPDEDLDRLQEYLRSLESIQKITTQHHIVPNDNVPGKGERSQWCGYPSGKCMETATLYKVIPYLKVEDWPALMKRVDCIRNAAPSCSSPSPQHFLVLGYELPWDKEFTEVRYGIMFYFEQGQGPESDSELQTRFLGYILTYANEANPQPFTPTHQQLAGPPPTKQSPPPKNEKDASQAITYYSGGKPLETGAHPLDECTAKSPEAGLKTIVSVSKQKECARDWVSIAKGVTGYPIAIAIGMKNAALELAKMPLSSIEGLLGGRDPFYQYPITNAVNAWKTLQVELDPSNLPSYGMFPPWAIQRLLSELPLVGQVFQINTGPEHRDRDLSPDRVNRQIFISRGIYGGDEAGQDTGLWAARTYDAYPQYEVYSLPYKHGTVIDVVWSMFNLSHGPGYAEAKYIMDGPTGPFDHLFLTGHSGGVQRSAAASRILANHGYSVQRILGIAGPSIGQAYVDTRYPRSFQIFLNPEAGANGDLVSRVGTVANSYSLALSYLTVIPLKYVFGMATVWDAEVQRCTYQFFNRIGFSNAAVTEVLRKRSSLHTTPLRLSLNEPVVFDAYVRSEYDVAFREDLLRPSDDAFPKLLTSDHGVRNQDVSGISLNDTEGCRQAQWAGNAKEEKKGQGGAIFRWQY